MTFYEAALRVLESAGRPMTSLEITEKSIQENLLSHVGKTPEQTMLSRLAAMARRPRGERRLVVTAKDTFALVDWQVPEDAEALAQTGVAEPNPDEDLPPLRPSERHPLPRPDIVRAVGRSGERKRWREEEEDRGRKRRFPPMAEVAWEVLSDASEGLRVEELIDRARARELASTEVTKEQFLTALLEDNQRRIDAGRRPQFSYDAGSTVVSLEKAGSPSEAPPLELQAAFAAALGIPLEGGRPVLQRTAERGGEVDPALQQTAKQALKDLRRAQAKLFRRRLTDLDVGAFEKSVVRVLQALGFRETKVAKRGKDGPLFTARRKEGSVELRYAIRLFKNTPSVDRRMVQDLRKDLGHYSAQVGLLVSPGEVRGDARAEAQSSGALVMLWCGDALAEKFFEARAGVTVQTFELFEVDEAFFDRARTDAEEARARREERQREKGARDPDRTDPRAQRVEPVAAAEPVDPAGEERADGAADGEGPDSDEDGPDEGGAEAREGGANGERKRRRRRRRGRRGRGPRAPGEEGTAPQSAEGAQSSAPPEAAAPSEAEPAAPSPPADPAPMPPPAPSEPS